VRDDLARFTGVRLPDTWDATRSTLRRSAYAQLVRTDVHPSTVAKWHRLGYVAGLRVRNGGFTS